MKPSYQISIALADDHVLLRNGVAELINSGNKGMHVIIQASDGAELVSALETTGMLPDVCVIDVNMPIMNGYQTVQIIHERWPFIKILAMSMYNHEYAIIDMMRKGACGYIEKGGEPDELFNAIQWAYNHGYYHNELTGKHASRMNDVPELKERELELLAHCCSDITYNEIATKMNLSLRAVEDYRQRIFTKLHIKSRAGLVVFAMKIGLVPEKA